jgi:hypothetical protein
MSDMYPPPHVPSLWRVEQFQSIREVRQEVADKGIFGIAGGEIRKHVGYNLRLNFWYQQFLLARFLWPPSQ